MPDDYPYASYRFRVTIDSEIQIVAGFSECSGLTMDNDVIEYRAGTDRPHVQKIPGLRKYSNIVLKRGITKDAQLYEWRRKVISSEDPYRLTGSIALLDEHGEAALTWSFTQAWPSKLEGPSLNAKNSEVAVETLELVVETLSLEAAA